MSDKVESRSLPLLMVAIVCLTACGTADESKETKFGAQEVADSIYSVVAGHRAVYTDLVVNRLSSQGVIQADENWEATDSLLLPAQLFRRSAEKVRLTNTLADYSLLSLWPVNRNNGPSTEAERLALQTVANAPDQNYYTEEKVGDVRYFVGVYADLATSPACVSCHNKHPQSPKRDFQLNDVMGAVVIRIPLN